MGKLLKESQCPNCSGERGNGKKQPKPIVMRKSKWKPARWRAQCVRQYRIALMHTIVGSPTKRDKLK